MIRNANYILILDNGRVEGKRTEITDKRLKIYSH